MAVICPFNKRPCSQCPYYRFDPEEDRMCCFYGQEESSQKEG